MVTLTADVPGLDELINEYRRSPQRLYEAMRRGMGKAVQNAAGQAKQNASGRPGPRVQTGRLRSSITGRVIERPPLTVRGLVGTNVVYGAVIELGFRGNQQVRAHSRKTQTGGVASVRAHSRTVNRPAYPYLRPAVMSPYAQRVISEVISREIAKEFRDG